MGNRELGLVSVIIPVYNAGDYLSETLTSVLAQTYKNIEIIAVDDGSSDSSVDILRSFAERVVLIQQPNSGPAMARNRGVMEANGEWVAFLDADDLWEPDKIEIQLQSMKGFDWSYTDIKFMGGVNDGKKDSFFSQKPSGNIFKKLICSNFISTSTVLIRRSVFNEVGGFDVELHSIQDWDLWIRVARQYPIAYIPESLVKYRIHSISTSRNSRKTLPNHLKVIEKTFSTSVDDKDNLHLKRFAKANSFSICSQIAEEEKDFLFSFQCAFNAFVQQPLKKHRNERMVKSSIKLLLYWAGLYGR